MIIYRILLINLEMGKKVYNIYYKILKISGSFFYFTKDRSMIIKSMEKEELDKFKDMLYDYC